MKTRQLRRQNELAGQLLNKLQQIVGLWPKLPNEDDMDRRVKHAERFAGAMAQAKENPNADSPPAGAEVPVM